MIQATDLRNHFRQVPFPPTRLVTRSGTTHDIRQPGGLIALDGGVIVGVAPNRRGVYRAAVRVPLADIIAVEPLPPEPA